MPPIFTSAEQGVQALLTMQARVIGVLAWLACWLLHVTVALLALTALWYSGTTAQEAIAAVRWMLDQATTSAVGAIAGVSAAGLAAGYWKACRWVTRRVVARLIGRHVIATLRAPDS